MANPEHLEIIKQGVEVWNEWRRDNPDIKPELGQADLSGRKLQRIDLKGVPLWRVDLSESDLTRANLSGARFRLAILSNACLIKANLRTTAFTSVDISGADLSQAELWRTVFTNTDLSRTIGLDTCKHWGMSYLDYSTLEKSGELSRIFLQGVGLPDWLIESAEANLLGAIQIYSCFISYSSQNEDFARRLHADLQDAGVRCWFAPEDMKGGRKLHHQIDEGIKLHDKLILILSEDSIASDWVQHEIKQTRKREKEEGRQKLFPISVTPFENIAAWDLFDPATVTNLADEVRSYFIPDFSDWKSHDSYQKAFERLLRDLKA